MYDGCPPLLRPAPIAIDDDDDDEEEEEEEDMYDSDGYDHFGRDRYGNDRYENERYRRRYYDSDESVSGDPDAEYGGGTCHNCGRRGHWYRGCPY